MLNITIIQEIHIPEIIYYCEFVRNCGGKIVEEKKNFQGIMKQSFNSLMYKQILKITFLEPLNNCQSTKIDLHELFKNYSKNRRLLYVIHVIDPPLIGI